MEEVPVDGVAPGDVVVVRAGEVVPVDGVVALRGRAVDESALTGEPLPVARAAGAPVRSGTANAGEAFELRATRPAAESAYAELVRLVEAAEAEQRPVRADRRPLRRAFLPVTLLLAGVAWAAQRRSRSARSRCWSSRPRARSSWPRRSPSSRASRARHGAGMIVKGGGAIERLGRARTVLLDKTGTLTLGAPRVERRPRARRRSRRTRSCDSPRPWTSCPPTSLAEALVHDAERAGLRLALPDGRHERPGEGIEGTVEGRRVVGGAAPGCRARSLDAAARAGARRAAGRRAVLVGVDGTLAGVDRHGRPPCAPDAADASRPCARRHRADRDGHRRPTGRSPRDRARARRRRVDAEQSPRTSSRSSARSAPTRRRARWSWSATA